MTAAARAELRAAAAKAAKAATASQRCAAELVDARVRATAAYAQALAEIRAIRGGSQMPAPAPAPKATRRAMPDPAACCTGDRAGYLRHRWHHTEPCEASRQANTDYARDYRANHPEDRERRRLRERARRAHG